MYVPGEGMEGVTSDQGEGVEGVTSDHGEGAEGVTSDQDMSYYFNHYFYEFGLKCHDLLIDV